MSVLDRWGPLAAAWLAVAGALARWLLGTPDPVLRQQLQVLQFWWLELTVWTGIVLGALVVRAIGTGLSRRDLAAMAGLAAVALSITLFVAPRTNRIYYDEQIYQGIAQNLADARRAQMCNDGTVEYGRLECWSAEYNKQPYAYPHLLSLAYRAFGVHEGVAFRINAGVAAATPVVLYMLVIVLFADRTAAFFAGLMLALTPHQAIWGATAAVEPSASLACVAALLAAAQFSRTGDGIALGAAAVWSVYAAQFRTESVLLLPAVGLLVWQHRRSDLARARVWWVALLAFALMAVHLAHLYGVRNDSWGSTDARLSLRYVAQNFRVNGAFYLADERYPVLFTLCAVAGLAVSGVRASRWPLVVYFLGFFGLCLLFYAGSYDYGADVRYSLMTYPPLSVLAGLGLAGLIRQLEGALPGVAAKPAAVAVLLAQSLLYAPVVRATTEEAWAARADVRFAADLAPALRGDQYVLTHNPAMFHLWGVNAGQMSMVMANPSHLEYLRLRYPGGVYLHWNFWCNVHDQAQREPCTRALALAPTVPIREHRERDQRFVLYRFGPAAKAPDESRMGPFGGPSGSPSSADEHTR